MGAEPDRRAWARRVLMVGLLICPLLPFPAGRCRAQSTMASELRFEDSGQSLGNAHSSCVALGDIDQDGDLDALVANIGSPSRAWLNDGDGTFADSGQTLPSGSCVGISDLDGDGDLDAFFAGEEGRVLRNEGRGRFEVSEQSYGGPGGNGLAMGDLDRDGDVDVAVSRWGHPLGLGTEIWLNDGRGQFRRGSPPPSVTVSGDVALGDVDGDGDLDLFLVNQADSIHDPISDELWLNDGHGRFPGPATHLGEECAYELVLGDLDGDGWLDAFVANSSHAGKSDPANRVFLNDGDGHLWDSGQALGDTYSLSVAVGDLDLDGDLDAFVGNWGVDRVWLNDGRGVFQELPQDLGTQGGMDVALGDLDGDGDLDAFVANHTWQGASGVNRVWLNLLRHSGS